LFQPGFDDDLSLFDLSKALSIENFPAQGLLKRSTGTPLSCNLKISASL